MKQVIEGLLSEDQFSFRRDDIRKSILALREVIEKQNRKRKTTFKAFVDLEKAFDNVKWKTVFKILKGVGVTYKDRTIIKSLYKKEIGVVRCGNSR